MANGTTITILVNVTPGFNDFADKSLVHELHVADQCCIGTALSTVLNDTFILLCERNKLAPFVNAVGHRLLHINILSSLAGPNGSKRMPMVWRGDRHSINLLILERLTNILVRLRLLTLSSLDSFNTFGEHVGIHVAKR